MHIIEVGKAKRPDSGCTSTESLGEPEVAASEHLYERMRQEYWRSHSMKNICRTRHSLQYFAPLISAQTRRICMCCILGGGRTKKVSGRCRAVVKRLTMGGAVAQNTSQACQRLRQTTRLGRMLNTRAELKQKSSCH